jgi:hypothetical protein
MHSVANDAIVAMETALLQQVMAYSPVIVPDLSKGNVIVIGALTGDVQISAAINAASYSLPLVFVFTQDSSGGHSVVWNSSYATTWGPDPTPNNSSAIGFIYNVATATWIPVHAFPDQVSISTVGGNLSILGNLTVSGQGYFSGTLNSSGISDTLGITTNQTLTAHNGLSVTAGGGSITGNVGVTGNVNTTGKVTAVQGLVATSGGAAITGNSTITGNLSLTGNTTVGGSLIASSTLSLGGAATLSSTLTAAGQITASSFYLGNSDFHVDTSGNIVGASLSTGSGNITGHTITGTTSIVSNGPISANGTISTTSGVISSPGGFTGISGHYAPMVPFGGNGWLVQFGTSVITTNGSGFGTVTFPSGFPGACSSVVICDGDWSGTIPIVLSLVNPLTTSGFNLHADYNNASLGGTIRVNWIAWGY